MAIAQVPFESLISHDGCDYRVHIPALSVPKCMTCGELSIDEVAGEQIDLAFRAEAGLLTPSQIREGRVKCGFGQQQEFAKCFGISSSTLSRWETGAQVQQRFHDGMLRAFFEVPSLRGYLANLHGVSDVLTA